METEKLYYQNPYLTEFTGRVLSCEEGKGSWLVVLDRTAFYPEGGGQPADHGTLGAARVLDTHEKDGIIAHTCDAQLAVGETVTGCINWSRRFDHMQQHSGEHILSGILCANYHCDNVGFHMGTDTVTIDYNTEISWEQALLAEAKANAVIWADTPVEISFPDADALAALDYRSKKELTGQVRIVAFPGADCCACCGTHVRRAGEVGLVKVLSVQKFREGVRMEILCGKRAMDYLSAVYEQDRAIGQKLSVKPVDTFAAVERLEEELQATKFRASLLEQELNEWIAASYEGARQAVVIRGAMTSDGVRRLADAVAKRCGGFAAVFAGDEGDGEARYNYALVRADGGDIAPLVKEMNAALSGRGGGRNGFAQGSAVTKRTDIESFFAGKELC